MKNKWWIIIAILTAGFLLLKICSMEVWISPKCPTEFSAEEKGASIFEYEKQFEKETPNWTGHQNIAIGYKALRNFKSGRCYDEESE